MGSLLLSKQKGRLIKNRPFRFRFGSSAKPALNRPAGPVRCKYVADKPPLEVAALSTANARGALLATAQNCNGQNYLTGPAINFAASIKAPLASLSFKPANDAIAFATNSCARPRAYSKLP